MFSGELWFQLCSMYNLHHQRSTVCTSDKPTTIYQTTQRHNAGHNLNLPVPAPTSITILSLKYSMHEKMAFLYAWILAVSFSISLCTCTYQTLQTVQQDILCSIMAFFRHHTAHCHLLLAFCVSKYHQKCTKVPCHLLILSGTISISFCVF